jgi:hypothetical protein
VVAALLLATSLTTSAYADSEKDLKRLKAIYEVFYDLFSQQSKDLGQDSNVYFVLLNPGVVIDPDLKFNDASTQSDIDKRRAFTSLIDRLVDPNWIYTPRLEKLFDLYTDIIVRDRQVLSLELPKDQEKELALARSILFQSEGTTKSPEYKNYEDTARQVAVLASQIKLKQTANQPVDPVLTQDYILAQDTWKSVGNKAKIIAALSTYNTINAQRPESWWGELGQKLLDPENVFTLSNVTKEPKYFFYPAYNLWTQENYSWTNLTIKSDQLDSRKETSRTSFGGSGRSGFKFWGRSANYNESSQTEYSFESEDKFELNIRTTQVFIERPWMEARVFTAPIWTWSKDSPRRKEYGGLLSDGKNPNVGQRPNGHSPFIPISLILAKDVTVKSSFDSKKREFAAKNVSGNTSFGWGPFSMGGNYNRNTTSEYKSGKFDSASISFAQPQIIGMFVRILPNTPIEKAGAKYVNPAEPK